jgi:hypothetical protein
MEFMKFNFVEDSEQNLEIFRCPNYVQEYPIRKSRFGVVVLLNLMTPVKKV